MVVIVLLELIYSSPLFLQYLVVFLFHVSLFRECFLVLPCDTFSIVGDFLGCFCVPQDNAIAVAAPVFLIEFMVILMVSVISTQRVTVSTRHLAARPAALYLNKQLTRVI